MRREKTKALKMVMIMKVEGKSGGKRLLATVENDMWATGCVHREC